MVWEFILSSEGEEMNFEIIDSGCVLNFYEV